jgi:hypothetical protein
MFVCLNNDGIKYNKSGLFFDGRGAQKKRPFISAFILAFV